MRISSLLVICSTKALGMVISSPVPLAFSKWPLSVSSFLDTRTHLLHQFTRSREFSFRSRKICSVPLNCSAKMGQTIFSLAETAEQDAVVITEHISSSYLRRIPPFYCEKPFIFVRKAPTSSPALCTGPTAPAPGPRSVC